MNTLFMFLWIVHQFSIFKHPRLFGHHFFHNFSEIFLLTSLASHLVSMIIANLLMMYLYHCNVAIQRPYQIFTHQRHGTHEGRCVFYSNHVLHFGRCHYEHKNNKTKQKRKEINEKRKTECWNKHQIKVCCFFHRSFSLPWLYERFSSLIVFISPTIIVMIRLIFSVLNCVRKCITRKRDGLDCLGEKEWDRETKKKKSNKKQRQKRATLQCETKKKSESWEKMTENGA